MTFSDRLRSLLDERDLTQKELAKQLHIPVSTLGGYVQGTSEPDFQTLKLIASFFDVSTDYLIGYYGNGKWDSDREAELIRVFRSLSSDQQGIYLDQGKSFIRFNSKNKSK